VKYAVNCDTGEAVAIKVLDKEKIQKQNMGNQIKKEISIMKMVKHKYIVGMIEVLASKTKIFIVLDLVTGGELFDKIVSVGKLTEEQAFFYFEQLVEGVEYCHKLGVCHRDLKPEVCRSVVASPFFIFVEFYSPLTSLFFSAQNLLLDEHGNLKISDFGLSSLYVGDAESDGASRTELLHTTCGTPNYVAPEVIADKGYDGKKADVWSIGVILYVLLAGFLPFDEGTIMALFQKIQNADFTYPKWFTADVRALLDQVLVADPKQRISLTQLRDHPWMKKYRTSSSSSEGGAAGAAGASAEARPVSAAAPSPSDAEMEAAVQEHDMGEDADEDDTWGALIGRTARGPRYLNAFDLVSQCGGFHLDRIFNPQTLQLTAAMGGRKPPGDQAASPAQAVASLPMTRSKSSRFGAASKQRDSVNFTSAVVPAEDLMKAVYEALTDMGFKFENSLEAAMNSGRLRANLMTAKGMVGIAFQVFTLCSTLSLLEIRRGKGDVFEWKNAYTELVDRRLAHLINQVPPEGEAKTST